MKTMDDDVEVPKKVDNTVHDTRICQCPICMAWKKEHGIIDDTDHPQKGQVKE